MCVVCIPQESLIDASEDSQLEAAIRASLQETHFDSSQAKQESRSDEESESELFSGSEEFISVCGSEEEEESEIPAKLRKSPHKDLGYKKEESRRPQPEPSARTEPGTTSNHRVLPCIDAGALEESPDKPESTFRGLDVNGKCSLFMAFVVAFLPETVYRLPSLVSSFLLKIPSDFLPPCQQTCECFTSSTPLVQQRPSLRVLMVPELVSCPGVKSTLV